MLYTHITIVETEAPVEIRRDVKDYFCGDLEVDRQHKFFAITEDSKLETWFEKPTVVATVELPEEMNADQIRGWLKTEPDALDDVMDIEAFVKEMNALSARFGTETWSKAEPYSP